MRSIYRNLPRVAVALVTFAIGMAVAVSAQEGGKDKTKDKFKSMKERSFCSNNWSNGDKISVNDLREMTIPASGLISVDGRQNGGIKVRGEDRSDVLVRACVQAWGSSEEAAKSIASGVKINTSGTVRAEGPEQENQKHWSVSYELLVPRSSNLDLKARNGGISIYGIDGTAEFETVNGGISLGDVAGSIKGRTTNGGVSVKLAGSSWKGTGLDVTTMNGGVNILMPENYAARVETGTVNGKFSSDIPALNVSREEVSKDDWGKHRPTKISLDLNGGGAPIRVATTNGGVRISTIDKE